MAPRSTSRELTLGIFWAEARSKSSASTKIMLGRSADSPVPGRAAPSDKQPAGGKPARHARRPRSANLLENALWSNALSPSSIRRMGYARLDARPELLPSPGSQGSFDFASSPSFGTSFEHCFSQKVLLATARPPVPHLSKCLTLV